MESSTLLLLAADLILWAHVLLVAFVVLGLFCILLGKVLGWSWVRNPWLRLVHAVTITVVVIQTWTGSLCPLTSIEMTLRARAGGDVYSESFIAHWLSELLYYNFSPWVFVFWYTLFGLAVAASWFWVRPRRFKNKS